VADQRVRGQDHGRRDELGLIRRAPVKARRPSFVAGATGKAAERLRALNWPHGLFRRDRLTNVDELRKR
jgi:hypothetical protein